MKRYRKWFFTGLILLAVELGFVALLNYIVDPRGFFRYGTWRHDVLHQFVEPNRNFIKTRYVALNPQRYDCLIFGSSRVNAIDGRLAKNWVCYNMTFGQGLPRNYLDSLRYIVMKGALPKTVLIGLDEFSYKYDPAEHTDFLRHPYPAAVHQNLAFFYLKYLVRYSPRSMKEPLEGFEGKRRRILYDHYGTGLEMPDSALEEAIEADPITYAKDPKFREPFITPGDRMDAALEEIRETVNLLKEHGIRLIVFINPIHKETYLATGLDKLFLFEKELSKITSFYDFSGLNSITTNNYYYYETSHYRRNAGALMLARIFNDPSVKVPDDFGVLVTRENIDEHLAYLRSQVTRLGSSVK